MNILRFSLLGLMFAFGLSSCGSDGASITETQYAATIVGDWRGTVGDDNETISFSANGRFISQVSSPRVHQQHS
jgi:hypothetical protein